MIRAWIKAAWHTYGPPSWFPLHEGYYSRLDKLDGLGVLEEDNQDGD